MSTGDLKNNLRKLQRLLQRIGYKDEVDYDGMSRGLPNAFLPVYNHALTSFSHHLVSKLSDLDIHLVGANDMRFVDLLYKVFRDVLDYKPSVPKAKFFTAGFAERKVIMCTDVVESILSYHRNLEPRKPVKLKKQNDPFSVGVANFGAVEVNLNPSAHRPMTAASGDVRAVNHIRPMTSTSYTPTLYASSDSPPPINDQPSIISVDVDTTQIDDRPQIEIIRNTDVIRKEVLGEEEERAATPPPENPPRMTPEATMMVICQKLEHLMQAVVSLEERQSSVEEILAIKNAEKHVEKEKEVLSAGQIENVLARVTLLESRMTSVEAKVSEAPRVRMVEGPTADEWMVSEPIRSVAAANSNSRPTTPPPTPCQDFSPPSTARTSDTETSDPNGNDQELRHLRKPHPHVVSELISQVVRENGSECSDMSQGLSTPSEDDHTIPPVHSLSQNRREQALRIESMLAETKQLTNPTRIAH